MTTATADTEASDDVESPLARLTDEQIEQLGKEFDAIHDQVYSELGDRDRRYITSMIEMHRRLAVMSRVMLLGSRYWPAWIGGTTPTPPQRSSRTWRSATTSCTASGTG